MASGVSVCLLLALSPIANAEISGPNTRDYTTGVTSEDTPDTSSLPILAITVDPVLWRIGRVGDRYQSYVISVTTREDAMRVSATEDRFVIHADGGAVEGLLDLPGSDPEFWDALDVDTREALLYKGEVAPDSVATIYVLAPELDTDEPPYLFEYYVNALDHTFQIGDLPVTAD
jgi:hypothetical protein